MFSTSEKFQSIKLNNEIVKKPITKMVCIVDNSFIISVNSQVTNDNSRNTSVKFLRKNPANKIKRSLTSILILRAEGNLYFKNKFFPEKEDKTFNLSAFSKKNENINNREEIEIKENKEVKDNKIEFKENKTEINQNKYEINQNNFEIKEETSTKNVNNNRNNDVNKDTCLITCEYYSLNKNIQENINEKTYKNGDYIQTYCRNDFSDRPPKVSRLFMDNYDYENKNIFSHSNNTGGNIKGSKKIPCVFYHHLLINNENNERYITASLNKRSHGKLSTFIYYTPRIIFA